MGEDRRATCRRFCADFRNENEGLALTEYLILLALITGLTMTSVLMIGENLQRAWSGWTDFYGGGIADLAIGLEDTGGGLDDGDTLAVSTSPDTTGGTGGTGGTETTGDGDTTVATGENDTTDPADTTDTADTTDITDTTGKDATPGSDKNKSKSETKAATTGGP